MNDGNSSNIALHHGNANGTSPVFSEQLNLILLNWLSYNHALNKVTEKKKLFLQFMRHMEACMTSLD